MIDSNKRDKDRQTDRQTDWAMHCQRRDQKWGEITYSVYVFECMCVCVCERECFMPDIPEREREREVEGERKCTRYLYDQAMCRVQQLMRGLVIQCVCARVCVCVCVCARVCVCV